MARVNCSKFQVLASQRIERGGFIRALVYGMLGSMDVTRLLQFVFAALISIGLAIAPLASSALAASAPSNGGMQVSDPSDDMPCCPEKQKQSGCQDCPLLAICTAKVMQNEPSANGLPI